MKKALPWILLVIGLALAATGGALGARNVAEAVSSATTWTSAGNQNIPLTQGDWVVYEETFARNARGTLTADDVTVRGPGGALEVTPSLFETLTINNRQYSSVARFTAPVDGIYTITVPTDGVGLMVGRPIVSTVTSTFGYVAMLGLGLLLALAAVVWLIVAFVVSRSKRRGPVQVAYAPGPAGYAPPPGSVPPYGQDPLPAQSAVGQAPPPQPGSQVPPPQPGGQWYPDPEDPTQWRWWNGTAWTDQRAPRP